MTSTTPCSWSQTAGTHIQKISFASLASNDTVTVVGIDDAHTLTCDATSDIGKKVTSMVAGQTIKKGSVFLIQQDIVVVGLGAINASSAKVDLFNSAPTNDNAMCQAWKKAGGHMWSVLAQYTAVSVMCQGMHGDHVKALVYGMGLSMWRFDAHRTPARPLPDIRCQSICIVHDDVPGLSQFWDTERHVIHAVHWGRHVANQPGNVIVPETFVEHINALKDDGVTVTILDQKTMQDQGFGALLGVAQGSDNPPFLAVMQWKGGTQDSAPVALVGKGVTFDSGGLSLKPPHGMEDMKMDKTGAVVVCATMQALARRKSPVHVVAVVALVENMVSGNAQRPGDIVTSLSGQTIEVLNTDAEGRLILADALTYVQKTYHPRCIVDVATLTGAVRVALGPVYAGLFANNDAMMRTLYAAGHKVGEPLWPLPLGREYDQALDCDVADMKNIATNGFGAGSSTAAQFLQRFVQPEMPWAHLDIAGVDHVTTSQPLCPKGGSAFGIQLLTHWIEQGAIE